MGKSLSIATLAAVLAFATPPAAWCGQLRAGTGKVAITSTPDEFPYAVHGERPYVGVHDEVYSRALVLEAGDQRLVLVSVEVTKLPDPAGIVKAIAQALAVPESHVLVTTTHTHNTPLVFFHDPQPNAVEAAEIARLTRGTLEAVRQANAQLAPARLAVGRGQAFININNGELKGLKSWSDPLGPSDKTLDVLKVDKADGTPLAWLINYASHAEVMFRSVTKDGGYEVSGDLPGAVARLLENQPGAAPVVLYTPGAEGDQQSLFKSLQPPGPLPAADEGANGWALLDAQARRLAEAVLDVVARVPSGESEARLSAAAIVVNCPGQRLHVDPRSGVVTSEDTGPVSIALSVFRINDFVFAGVGGDVASGIGEHFKQASPAAQSTLISMANGSLGYLLTDAAYQYTGHSVQGSPVKPHCAEAAIVDGLVRLIGH